MTGFFLTILGVCALSLGMKRHFLQVFPALRFSRARQYTARFAGALLLIAAAFACVSDAGVGLGLTIYVAYLNLAAFGLALVLAWRASSLREF
ncbi:MAG: DUF3325 family protein [Pseudomonadota bacterium]